MGLSNEEHQQQLRSNVQFKNGVDVSATAANVPAEVGFEGKLPISRRLPARLSDLSEEQVMGLGSFFSGLDAVSRNSAKTAMCFVGHYYWAALNVLVETFSLKFCWVQNVH